MVPGINFWKITDLLRDRPYFELIIVSRKFSVFALLSGEITGISLEAMNSCKKVKEITGPALSRINSVIISARTVDEKRHFYANKAKQKCATFV